jgi:pyrroline-5-carboxylate reductase
MQHRKITFIGAGNMARAIIAGLVAGGYPAKSISVCAPSAKNRDALAADYGIVSSGDNLACAREADVIVLAVKPQMMADVCQPLRDQIDFSGKLVLSIAAGIQVSRFYQLLADNLNIVRIMPNTPSLVGKGMSGLYAPQQVSQQDRDYTSDLMASVGKVCWVDDENGINSVIAAAGSAPAYFFPVYGSHAAGSRTYGLRQPDGPCAGATSGIRRRCAGGSQPGDAVVDLA